MLAVPLASASQPDWQHLVAEAQAGYSVGNYQAADATYRSALALAEQGSDWQLTARSLGYLARVEQRLGKLDEAQSLYKRAFTLDQAHNSNLDAAAIQVNLARIARTKGHPDQALPLCQQALNTFRALLSPEHPFVADALDTLASIQVATGKDIEAASTFEQSLAIRKKATPPDDLKLAATLSDFAALQTTLGRYREAEANYTRALTLRVRELGESHPDVAETRLGLAVLYRAERQFSKADALAGLVLPALTAALGPEHLRVANASQEIAALNQQEGRLDEADSLLRRAQAIYDKAFGPDYRQIAVVLAGRSAIEVDRHNYAGAEELCKHALAVAGNAFGTSHPEYAAILHKLAVVYALEARFEESAVAHAQALEIRRRSSVENYSAIAHWELDYASVLRKIHRKKEAGELEARAELILADAQRQTGDAYRVDIRDLERFSK
jgi:tetratricopeptide (TPR) repeat protein